MDSRISQQGFTDLNQLLVGVQSQIDKDPFAAAELAGPTTATAEPLMADLVSERSRDFTTLFEQFYCVHPSLSISPNPWPINTWRRLYRDRFQLPSSNRRYLKST